MNKLYKLIKNKVEKAYTYGKCEDVIKVYISTEDLSAGDLKGITFGELNEILHNMRVPLTKTLDDTFERKLDIIYQLDKIEVIKYYSDVKSALAFNFILESNIYGETNER